MTFVISLSFQIYYKTCEIRKVWHKPWSILFIRNQHRNIWTEFFCCRNHGLVQPLTTSKATGYSAAIVHTIVAIIQVRWRANADFHGKVLSRTYIQLNPAMSNAVISNTPLSRTVSRSPSLNQPWLSRTSLRSEETLVNISQEVQSRHLLTRCTESWGMYRRVHGINQCKARLTGLTAERRRRQVAGI